MSQTATPTFLRASQLAKLLYVSVKTVDNMRARGDLVAIPLPGGRQYRYPSDQDAVRPFLPRQRSA